MQMQIKNWVYRYFDSLYENIMDQINTLKQRPKPREIIARIRCSRYIKNITGENLFVRVTSL